MTRTTKDLLILLRDWCLENFEMENRSGLCDASSLMVRVGVISHREMMIIDDYVSLNAPKYSKLFSWPPYQLQPRIEWLNSEIDRITS